MLVAKGYEVAFRKKSKGSTNGRAIKPPASYALLHDPDSEVWPYSSLLVAPFKRTRDDGDAAHYNPAIEYFGYDPLSGRFKLPPEKLSAWTLVCQIDAIDYWRPGGQYEGDYEHDFQGRGWIFQNEKTFPSLYRIGRVYRLELGSGAVVNWRGIVHP